MRVNWLQSPKFTFRGELKEKHEDFLVKPDMSDSSRRLHLNREEEMNNHCTYTGVRIQQFIKLNHLKLEADLVTAADYSDIWDSSHTGSCTEASPRTMQSILRMQKFGLFRGGNQLLMTSRSNKLNLGYLTHLPLGISNRQCTFFEETLDIHCSITWSIHCYSNGEVSSLQL